MEILKRPTLVLNRNWTPISTVTVQNAIVMLHGEFEYNNRKLPKAQVLDVKFNEDNSYDCVAYDWNVWAKLIPSENEEILNTGGGKKFRVPEIVIASRYQLIPRNQLNFNRKNLFRRDEKCQYCNKNNPDSIDHIIPRSKGGKNNWENCVACCFKCNQKKKDKTLEEVGMGLLRKPCKPGLELLGQSQFRMKSWEIFFKI